MVGLVEGGHQVVQLALEVGGHGLAALALLPVLVLGSLQGLARVVLEALDGQGVASVLDQLNDGVVEGILVLLQPSGQVVGHGGGVVDDSEVRIRVRTGVGLGELGPLAEHVGHEFLGEGGVGGLGKRDSSSKMARKAMGFSNMSMHFCRSMPKSTLAQSRPSLTYISCSRVNMCWLKNCWSFSLT